MKKITMMAALAVATMAVSCQNDNIAEPTAPSDNANVAYISLKVDSSTTRATGTDGSTEDGTAGESKVATLALMTFSKGYDYLGYKMITAPTVDGSDETFVSEVSTEARRFFAIVNPAQSILDELDKLSSLTQAEFESLPAIEMLVSEVATDNKFTMVNCGAISDGGLLEESLIYTDIEKLSDKEDNPTPVDITVERMAAKFEYSVNGDFAANTESKFDPANTTPLAKGEVLGVALTARNKASHPYTEILTDQLTGNNVYRKDHNMKVGDGLTEATAIRTELTKNFHWLKNADPNTDAAFNAPSTAEYVLENTCEKGTEWNTSNNLTQAIVKAEYYPTLTNGSIATDGESWFKIYTTSGAGTLYLTFDEVVKLYKGTYSTPSGDAVILSQATKDSMDKQLSWIMTGSALTGKSWGDDGLTVDDIDNSGDYGGYLAATVGSTSDTEIGNSSDYIVQYYRKAVNFYNVFIQHDEKQGTGDDPADKYGRWGMVRNNAYSLDVTGIMREGLPYIPDPTDPKVVDPENLKPEDPEPADKLKAYVGVSITVKPWVVWSQSTPLE